MSWHNNIQRLRRYLVTYWDNSMALIWCPAIQQVNRCYWCWFAVMLDRVFKWSNECFTNMKKDKSAVFCLHILLWCSVRVAEWGHNFLVTFFFSVCVCGGPDQKAMILNMSDKCPLCKCFSVLDYTLAWLHHEYFCPLFITSSASSAYILPIPSLAKKTSCPPTKLLPTVHVSPHRAVFLFCKWL